MLEPSSAICLPTELLIEISSRNSSDVSPMQGELLQAFPCRRRSKILKEGNAIALALARVGVRRIAMGRVL